MSYQLISLSIKLTGKINEINASHSFINLEDKQKHMRSHRTQFLSNLGLYMHQSPRSKRFNQNVYVLLCMLCTSSK